MQVEQIELPTAELESITVDGTEENGLTNDKLIEPIEDDVFEVKFDNFKETVKSLRKCGFFLNDLDSFLNSYDKIGQTSCEYYEISIDITENEIYDGIVETSESYEFIQNETYLGATDSVTVMLITGPQFIVAPDPNEGLLNEPYSLNDEVITIIPI